MSEDVVLGIDIGGTRLKAGLVSRGGRVTGQRATPTPGDREAFRAALADLAQTLGGEARAIGIGCKGIIDTATTRIRTLPGTLRFLEGERLSELCGGKTPVFADNDARVAMRGEMEFGAARGCRDALLVTLGTGVGGAVLAGGRLLEGACGVAGHLGHVVVDPDGPYCICGNRGCLETAFSAKAIEAEAWRAVHAGVETALAGGELSCAAVFAAAAGGDRVAKAIRDRAIGRLAAALAGLVFVFDPERVIIGGQISEAGEALLEPLAAEVQERTAAFLGRKVPVVRAASPDRDGTLGAAALAFQGLGR